ncbi:EpsG family protein [Cupriavidus taiwanensis]|uniref:EpsG family protein n=1 Tax=Cupriavidus taiwanensis TaxID=164546 RepID=UPI000E192572|nr:EpsG family protein [Cupriavidus taiwanensis]SOY49464.1 conserved membrane hypothetical protein [Cupriavidus taiwanensis]
MLGIFILVAGLRFETGYDWLAYEIVTNNAPSIVGLFTVDALAPQVKSMEPLFVLLVAVVKTMGGNVQLLYLVTVTFNAYVLYRFLKYTRAKIAVCLAIYACWLFLAMQMGVIRQSVAVSFFLLSIIAFDKGKMLKQFVFLIAALLMHYSSIMFLPLFFTRIWQKIIAARLPILFGFALFYVSGLGLYKPIMLLLQSLPSSFLAGKLAMYTELGPAEISFLSRIYFFMNLMICLYLAKSYDKSSRIDTVLLSASFMLVMCQSLFSEFPLIWNRVQYLAVTAQSVLLFRNFSRDDNYALMKFGMAATLSMAVLVKDLTNPAFLPYLPYQWYPYYLYTGEPGDGRARTVRFYDKYIKSVFENKSESLDTSTTH